MSNIDLSSDVPFSKTMIEKTARRAIDDIFEVTDDHARRGDVLRIVSELLIAMRASEEASPPTTARDIARFVRPLKEGHYLAF
jgi:hypothetical protein